MTKSLPPAFAYFSQKEVCVTEQDVFPPVGEIEEQALQGVLGYETQLVVHVHRQSEGWTTILTPLSEQAFTDGVLMQKS